VRRLLGSYRLTPAGGALIFVLAVAVVVLLLGPRHEEAPAFVVIAVVIAILAVRGTTMRLGADPTLDALRLEERRREFGGRERAEDVEEPDGAEQQEDWRRARERYGR
jgi:hypothetical protein